MGIEQESCQYKAARNSYQVNSALEGRGYDIARTGGHCHGGQQGHRQGTGGWFFVLLLPVSFLMVRRPEDVGLFPDGTKRPGEVLSDGELRRY